MLSGVEPAVFRPFAKEVTALSLPPKMFPGETQAKPPGALPVRRFRGERALVYCSQRSQTRHGDRLERSIFTFTARKMIHRPPRNLGSVSAFASSVATDGESGRNGRTCTCVVSGPNRVPKLLGYAP